MSRDGVGGNAIGIETQLTIVAQISGAEIVMIDIPSFLYPKYPSIVAKNLK